MANMVALGAGTKVYAVVIETNLNEFFILRAARV
jgi:hypothetical protein